MTTDSEAMGDAARRDEDPDDEGLDDETAEVTPNPGLTRGRIVAACVLGAVVLIAGAFVGGWLIGRGTPDPTTTSAAAGFARDMQTHHEQAVDMAMSAYAKAEDPEIRQLAYDIATSQQQQAGQLYGFLSEWNLPQASPEKPMSWMILPTIDGAGGSMADHGMGSAQDDVVPDTMPGYATEAQLKALDAATGMDAERIFLTLMIAHHQGGIAMAQAVLQRTDVPVIRDFANAIIASQTSEIDYMQSLLDARGGPVQV